ncbi:MAG: 50S ribosomal protein L15 [Candidatus Omnitrophica bacterium]|nr:50S ribosomal protein L15 [Candidatus Omnitrophota bacterium]MCM8829109.1 50S ribosomal protein L15 [Candidatus Omnitrophota bacterium]
MKVHNLKPTKGSKHKKKIVGRGHGSGHGQQSTRGHKGHKSRSGYHLVGNFEGGQMPLIRRIPKRGFNNKLFKTVVQETNIGLLNAEFNDGEIVTPEILAEKGIIKKKDSIVKILGKGRIEKKINVSAHAFSKKAKESIEKAGGSITVLKK